jgi:hypothetical protein
MSCETMVRREQAVHEHYDTVLAVHRHNWNGPADNWQEQEDKQIQPRHPKYRSGTPQLVGRVC